MQPPTLGLLPPAALSHDVFYQRAPRGQPWVAQEHPSTTGVPCPGMGGGCLGWQDPQVYGECCPQPPQLGFVLEVRGVWSSGGGSGGAKGGGGGRGGFGGTEDSGNLGTPPVVWLGGDAVIMGMGLARGSDLGRGGIVLGCAPI